MAPREKQSKKNSSQTSDLKHAKQDQRVGRNGLKELMVRTGALWAVSGGLRVEPFLGWYCGYGRDDFKKVVLGLWCSYVF